MLSCVLYMYVTHGECWTESSHTVVLDRIVDFVVGHIISSFDSAMCTGVMGSSRSHNVLQKSQIVRKRKCGVIAK